MTHYLNTFGNSFLQTKLNLQIYCFMALSLSFTTHEETSEWIDVQLQ